MNVQKLILALLKHPFVTSAPKKQVVVLETERHHNRLFEEKKSVNDKNEGFGVGVEKMRRQDSPYALRS